jgi:hypothetical protein
MNMKILNKITCLVFYTICSISFTGNAQAVFKSGFAKASIEPSKYPFSLTLAGYGYPRDGRFSLDWVKKATLENCTAFTGNNEALFAVNNDHLLMTKAGGQLDWKSIGKSDGITSLAAGKKILYAVNHKGELVRSGFSGGLNWKKIAGANGAVSIAVLDDILYAADQHGVITFSDLSNNTPSWTKLTSLSGLVSMVSYDGSLYGLTANDVLMKLNLKHRNASWTKIARYNGVSYDVHLKFIAAGNHTLYGITIDNSVFAGKHLTTGDLSVTALAISSGKQTVVVVGADLCGLGYDFVTSVKQEVNRIYHLPAEAVMVNSSHTHFGPVAQHWPAWPEFVQQPDSIYMNGILRPAIVKAVGAAIRAMQPADLYFGRGKTAIGANRALTGDYVPYDNDVDVLSVVRKKDQQKTVLFLTGCHAVFENRGAEGFTVSPNFPGVTRKLLTGKNNISNAVFIQGCGGDINPVDHSHQKTGESLAADVNAVLACPMEKLQGKINFYMDSINFPVKKWTEQEVLAFRKENDKNNEDVEEEKNVRWADHMLELNAANQIPASMPVYIQTFNIGNWKLIGLSREAVTDYSLGIKKLWPGKMVSVAGYCNDVSSYLPTSLHIKAGTYEGFGSFFWYAQPSIFPESVYETVIDKVKNENR